MNSKNVLTGVITIGVIAICWIMYQSQVVIPQEKIEATERQANLDRIEERLAEEERKRDYDSCIFDAYSKYKDNWNGSCETFGKEEDCSLTNFQGASRWDEIHEADEADCLAIYKAN